jgi:hypothetical protein
MSANVVRASASDAKYARTHALRASGFTFEQLRDQAERGTFDTSRARRAWVIASGVDQNLPS